MPEEIKERLSKTEYDKVGEMLLELIAECPFIPKDAKIKYNALEVGKCVSISTAGGSIKKRNVLGGFTAELAVQVLYQSFPTTNSQMINSQSVVDNITSWMEDVENLPSLSKNRKVTKIIANPSFPDVIEVGEDKSTVYVSNLTLEYKKEEANW